ncbi:hypothetical protein BJ875DRAFT_438596 [Amylocarpus encephaloides]|uniref:GPI inositol-deacylase winged helix domain-containing protein n=1 Tax=Amylocarpus encephaloides TaxID=45428 RepID=A0A9P7YQG2_9HELO|nr:hypothetical protein BJ875DRAFT_438596 [Amylocarpus encephaloides]
MDVAGGGDSYKKEITDQILKRARGNFPWVHLAVQKINKCCTKVDVENALKPCLLAAYARRLLRVEELYDALGSDDLLEIHRTIGDLCGIFVVVDKEEKVVMNNATAREYLFHSKDSD